MTIFHEIIRQYGKADETFQKEVSRAKSAASRAKKEAARDRNDQAYFVYLFSRLEAEIHLAANNLIATRRTSRFWTQNRSWEILSPKKQTLMNKAALLLAKGGTEWNQIKVYYDERNEIAHGKTWTTTYVIPNVGRTMHNLVKKFNRK